MPRKPPDMPTGEDYERVRQRVAASRAAQGLPPTIEDPAILERAAAVFRQVDPDASEQGADDDAA